MQIVFRNYKVSSIMLVCFNLTLLNLTQNSLPKTHLQIQVPTRIEVVICFFYGAPSTKQFYSVKWSKSFLLGRICGEQSLSFLMLVFHHHSTQILRIYF